MRQLPSQIPTAPTRTRHRAVLHTRNHTLAIRPALVHTLLTVERQRHNHARTHADQASSPLPQMRHPRNRPPLLPALHHPRITRTRSTPRQPAPTRLQPRVPKSPSRGPHTRRPMPLVRSTCHRRRPPHTTQPRRHQQPRQPRARMHTMQRPTRHTAPHRVGGKGGSKRWRPQDQYPPLPPFLPCTVPADPQAARIESLTC